MMRLKRESSIHISCAFASSGKTDFSIDECQADMGPHQECAVARSLKKEPQNPLKIADNKIIKKEILLRELVEFVRALAQRHAAEDYEASRGQLDK